MPLLVDGNNFLYAARTFPRYRRINRDEVCRLLGEWGRRSGTPVTIVFDGPSPPLAVLHQMQSSGPEVRFSGGRSADDVLVELIERAQRPGQLTVVSSDHAIQHSARYHRATGIDAEDFVRDLLEDPGTEDETAPPAGFEKPESLSEEETRKWLAEFGEDPDEEVSDDDLMDL